MRHIRHLLLFRSPLKAGPSSRQGGTISHAIEPVADGLPRYNGMRLAHQHKKGRLKGVFGILQIDKEPATDTKHHGAMPAHESLERDFIAVGQKSPEQFRIR